MIDVNKDFENIGASAAMSVWDMAKRRFLDLGREDTGAALVITLAMFFLMYLACCGVFAVSTAVKERIHLQNAADAAVYSAAVVQADTLSRIATINRAMSWTYADMTRLQMDYIVRRWLGHTCDHYKQDLNGANGKDGLAEYNKNSILYHLGIRVPPPNTIFGPCSLHKTFGVGYYIGADDISPLMVHLNGRDPSAYRMPKGAGKVNLPKVSRGVNVLEAVVEAELVASDLKYTTRHVADTLAQVPRMAMDIVDVANMTWKCLTSSTLDASIETRAVLLDNLLQARNIDLSTDTSDLVPNLMKIQINLDKLTIAKMNVCERYLALDLPNRIGESVLGVLKSNLADPVFSGDLKQIEYVLIQSKALADELAGSLPSYLMDFNHDLGYLRDLFNTEADENRFLAFSDQGDIYKAFDTGINQWFVRGNGSHRTEWAYGIQRCYKHMTREWIAYDRQNQGTYGGGGAVEPLADFHATHSPLEPTSWNTKCLEKAKPSCALYSEWEWWSDTWYCFKIWIPYPPGYITIHLNLPHYKEIWPSKPSCSHNDKPGLLGLKSGQLTMPDWHSFFNVGSLSSAAERACIKKKKFGIRKFRSHDYTPNLDLGFGSLVRKLASLDNLLGNYEPIEDYHDGCFIWPDLLSPRSSICKFTGYSRLYADDPHLYNSSFVGFKALPLVVDSSYFGKFGTLSVGIRRKNQNVFMRILQKIEGIFSAFDPDWNGFGGATHTYVFASAKAGYKDKGEDADARTYKIDWQPNNQSWNLCQSDWDAVFVPVRKANAVAMGIDVRITDEVKVPGVWYSSDDDVLEQWVSDDTKWMTLDGDKGDVDGWDSISAPKGVLRGGDHKGTLNWRELSHVMYH